jgi:hypothetical protein
MTIEIMLYKPCGLAGACEDDARSLIVVFYENRDASPDVAAAM